MAAGNALIFAKQRELIQNLNREWSGKCINSVEVAIQCLASIAQVFFHKDLDEGGLNEGGLAEGPSNNISKEWLETDKRFTEDCIRHCVNLECSEIIKDTSNITNLQTNNSHLSIFENFYKDVHKEKSPLDDKLENYKNSPLIHQIQPTVNKLFKTIHEDTNLRNETVNTIEATLFEKVWRELCEQEKERILKHSLSLLELTNYFQHALDTFMKDDNDRFANAILTQALGKTNMKALRLTKGSCHDIRNYESLCGFHKHKIEEIAVR